MHRKTQQPKSTGCRDSHPKGRTLAEMVEWYRRERAPERKTALRHFTEKKTLAEAIHAAAMAETSDGTMDSHQRRVGRELCEMAADRLLQHENEIRKCKSFDDLFRLVTELTADITRFGALAQYDTALRIGAKLGLAPSTVYLHCGTKKGARELGLDTSRGVVEKCDLPAELRKLSGDDVENFLCICKGKLRRFQKAWMRQRPSQ